MPNLQINDEDALTLSYALMVAEQAMFTVMPGRSTAPTDLIPALDSFRVRLHVNGRGDSDEEQELERLHNLGYDR
jgi:hypothetical protein